LKSATQQRLYQGLKLGTPMNNDIKQPAIQKVSSN